MPKPLWTELVDITKARVTYLNGLSETFVVDTIVRMTTAEPLWIVHRDKEGNEVITPWATIFELTILERRQN